MHECLLVPFLMYGSGRKDLRLEVDKLWDLLGRRRMSRLESSVSQTKGRMKGLMKLFSTGLDSLKEWEKVELLKEGTSWSV